MDKKRRPKLMAHKHPFAGREPKGTKDSIADNEALLANIRGMVKGDELWSRRVQTAIKHADYDNDYVIDSVWWHVMEKRDEWDRIRDLPIAPSLRRALFTCAVNHGLGAAIAMLESINAAAAEEAAAEAAHELDSELLDTELEVKVVQGEAEVADGQSVVQAPRVIARKRVVKPRDYDFGERTLRYTKYQFYLLYRQPWVKKVIRRARDNNRPDVA